MTAVGRSPPAAGSRVRRAVLRRLARLILGSAPARRLRIGIDGVDGVGKTRFAEEVSVLLREAGRPVLRASVDGFHQPRALRYRRGRESPEGFFHDSHDRDALRRRLLLPLGPGGTGLHRTAIFDHRTDAPLRGRARRAPAGAVLLLDGIFLQRPDLRLIWDLVVFLDAPFGVTVPRGAARGPGWGAPDPAAPSNRRYVEGQRLYLRTCRPRDRAAVVIDNTRLDRPIIRAWRRDRCGPGLRQAR